MKIILLLVLFCSLTSTARCQEPMQVQVHSAGSDLRMKFIKQDVDTLSKRLAPETLTWWQKQKLIDELSKFTGRGHRDPDSSWVAGQINIHRILLIYKSVLTDKQIDAYLRYRQKQEQEWENHLFRWYLYSLKKYTAPLTLTEEQEKQAKDIISTYLNTCNWYKTKYPEYTYRDVFIRERYYPNKLYEDILITGFKKILTEEQYKNFLVGSQAERAKAKAAIKKFEYLVQPEK